MNKYEKKLDNLLTEAGAVLARSRKHKIFRLEDGSTFVSSSTPSDQNVARNELSVLRRLLSPNRTKCNAASEESSSSAPTSSQPKHRFRAAPNPARKDVGVLIREARSSHDPLVVSVHVSEFRFLSIVEVLMAADESEAFWGLDACGRMRALVNLTQRITPVQILPTSFITATKQEVQHHYSKTSVAAAETLESIVAREGPLNFALLSQWGLSGVPGIYLNDPILGTCLIEANAWSVLENTNYLFLRYGPLSGSSYQIASPVWSAEDPTKSGENGREPDHYIFSSFVTKGMMQRKRFRLLTTASWTDPRYTKEAIAEIIDIGRNQRNQMIDRLCD